MAKAGIIKFIGLVHKNFVYEIPDQKGMEEYKKRFNK